MNKTGLRGYATRRDYVTKLSVVNPATNKIIARIESDTPTILQKKPRSLPKGERPGMLFPSRRESLR